MFGMKNAEGVFPLSPREERMERDLERGELDEMTTSSPRPSPPLGEERETERAAKLGAYSWPNTMDIRLVVTQHGLDVGTRR